MIKNITIRMYLEKIKKKDRLGRLQILIKVSLSYK